jgi:hypothetical protein
VKWAERWMARAQRKAARRDERFRRHQDGVRAGTESPGFLDRLESSGVLDPANPRHFPRHVNAGWPLDARPDDASLRLANAWLTWVGHGPVAGPDGVAVRIWIRSADQDLPFGYTPGDQGWVRRRDIAASGNDYTVCIRRMPAGRAQAIRRFAFETSARWYAVGLAQKVREGRYHRAAANRYPCRAAPDRRPGPCPGRGDLRGGPAGGTRLRLAAAAGKCAVAPGTNGPAINLPGGGTSQRQHTTPPDTRVSTARNDQFCAC